MRNAMVAAEGESRKGRKEVDLGGEIHQSLVQRLTDVGRHSRPRIMRNQEWDAATAQLDALDLAELVLGLLGLDAVHGETALGVVDEAEVLAGLLDADNIHEAGRVRLVGAHLAVDLDQALHQDGLGLAVVQGVLEAVADEDNKGQAVASLVGTGGGLGSVGTGQFVQEPVLGRAKALLVLLRCS